MATYEQGMRGNGRGAEHDREEMMRDPETMSWRGSGRDVRREMDSRTHRDEIDRRLGWEHRERMGGREMRGEQGRGGYGYERGRSPGERFMRGEAGDVPSGGRIESTHYMPERSYGSSAPSGYGTARYGSEYHGDSGGYGGNEGYGNYGSAGVYEAGEPTSPTPPYAGGGFGGYGGGTYGGSYGGMGPGPDGRTPPAGSYGGVSGAGSLMGTYGDTAGWQEENQGMRPGSFALHSMMERQTEGRGRQRRGWEREGPLVRDVMTRDPKTIHPDSPIREAAQLMRSEDAGVMPVVENGRVIGMITDRDIAMRIVAEGRDSNTQVRHVMSGDVHVCTSDDKLTDAVRIMGEENVRRLPVVDRDDHLKGMLSMTDVAREAEMDYALQEALEQIASRRSFWSRW